MRRIRQIGDDRLSSHDEMRVFPTDRRPAARVHAEQVRQRVRVGMLGLAAVVLLIGLASAIFSTVNHDRPVSAVGASKPEVVANMGVAGAAPATGASNEPLAELGVTPSAANTPAATRNDARPR